jgi:hypothetical protein
MHQENSRFSYQPLVMGTGHPRANFCQPAPVPAETRTRLYGCGIPMLTGMGLKGPVVSAKSGTDTLRNVA